LLFLIFLLEVGHDFGHFLFVVLAGDPSLLVIGLALGRGDLALGLDWHCYPSIILLSLLSLLSRPVLTLGQLLPLLDWPGFVLLFFLLAV
jgi:hypothetical protein